MSSELESVNLSAYRTRELASEIAEATSIPGTLRQIFFQVMLALLLLPLAVVLLNLLTETRGFWSWTWTLGYALVFALLLGFAFACYRALARLLGNLETILSLSMETTAQIVHDEARVRKGQARFPNATQCLEFSYQEIIQPMIEASVKKNFFILSGPVLWVYRGILDRTLHRVLKKSAQEMDAKDEESPNSAQGFEADLASAVAEVSASASQIEASLKKASQFVKRSARSLRNFGLLLPRMGLFLFFAIGLSPLVWHWLS